MAEDEQVRKLYLGRNFELKRKDWLHEEAKSEAGVSLENIIASVENALAWNEKIIEANTQKERSFGHQYISADSTIADLGLDDYSKFLFELKQSLIQYGKQNKNAEILNRANKFLNDDGDINTDLNTILLFLKSEQQ